METQVAKLAGISDWEFVSGLRQCVLDYLDAIDDWEAEFKKFNRLSGVQSGVPADLQQAQSRYLRTRAKIESKIPRARQLCRRFEVSDPWSWILKIKPGVDSGTGSALGDNERGLIMSSLRKLEFRIADNENPAESEMRREQPVAQGPGLLRRILNYFF